MQNQFLQEALEAAIDISYPVICKAAYILESLGSRFTKNEA